MIVPQKIDNLFVAGRCASMTHGGQSSARVTGPCFVMGQAAGTAADLALGAQVRAARGRRARAAAAARRRRREPRAGGGCARADEQVRRAMSAAPQAAQQLRARRHGAGPAAAPSGARSA